LIRHIGKYWIVPAVLEKVKNKKRARGVYYKNLKKYYLLKALIFQRFRAVWLSPVCDFLKKVENRR